MKNYDEIEYPKINPGKTYKEYLAEAGYKFYRKMPVFSVEERASVEGVGTDTFLRERREKTGDN